LELLKAIPRWNEKILHNPRLIYHAKLTAGAFLNVARQFGYPKPGIDLSVSELPKLSITVARFHMKKLRQA
jgi:hypothetical protein